MLSPEARSTFSMKQPDKDEIEVRSLGCELIELAAKVGPSAFRDAVEKQFRLSRHAKKKAARTAKLASKARASGKVERAAATAAFWAAMVDEEMAAADRLVRAMNWVRDLN